MLKQRVIFGALGVILAILVLTFCNVTTIGVCVAVISMIGLYEFYNVTGVLKRKCPVVVAGFLFAALSFVGAVLHPEYLKTFMLPAVIAFVFVIMMITVIFHSKNTFSDSALCFLGTVYISLFFMHIILIRQYNFGKLLIWMLFISAWSTDTFAYFAGKVFGKHKLCPAISPKKTIEGSVGGIAGCIIVILIYSFICASVVGCRVNCLNAALFACVASVVSQFGDLAASCIKREHNAKDYGNLIPGHGGILDRFDSTLLIAPLSYYMFIYLPVFVK